MTLRPEPDVSHADWFTGAAEGWPILAMQGPPGFEAYATVPYDDGESETYRSDDAIMAIVVEIAARHTRTPDDVFFGLWDGWGELTDAGRAYTTLRGNWLRDLWFRPTPPRIRPAFDDDVLDAPKVDLEGERSYLLFRGPASDVGDWGARPYGTDVERTLPSASLTWPADRAWFVAADVDPTWLCVGGSQRLIDEVLAHPDLSAEVATHGAVPALDPEDR
ncbi:hypothetical protein IDH50_16370 [Aeromicrobium tamlense]|uniref:Uncharacterized protein n=1 Tax=Aeromicrobium tamlense TaxID=375541 RepID=A0A8I0KJZ4_9ACTN|nr:hypothetical protein [Aeromicrobium tamlense]MBD1271822.1 hypothetical protein [Aeromicrobium tamlense]NYI38989.1 hypothetical protein [Aeromicrobium tamlense]